MNMLPYSGFPALPKNIEDMHNQLVTLGLNDVKALTARIKKCEDWVDNVEETDLTGNPVVFQNALAVPAKSLTATLNPIQDLHGYDHPWAGGAGKNLYGGTSSEIFDLPRTLASGTVITVSMTRSGTGNVTLNLYKANESTRYDFYTISGTFRTITLTQDTARVMFYADSDVTFSKVQLEVGSSVTSYEPYSNICPISGRTGTGVVANGENMLRSGEAKTYTENGITFTSDGKGTYTVKGTSTAYASCNFACDEYTTPKGSETTVIYNNTQANSSVSFAFFNGNTQIDSTGMSVVNRAYSGFVAVSEKVVNKYQIQVSSGQTVNMTIQPMFARGNVASNPPSFVPYKTPVSCSIQLGQTVYGGQVDFKTGVVRVTHKGVDMGDLTWNYDAGTTRFYSGVISDIDAPSGDVVADVITEQFKATYASGQPAREDGTIAISVGGAVWVYNTGSGTDKNAFASLVDGHMMVYKLATPTELTLTPALLEMLKGYNRVSSDDASSLTVTAYTGVPWEPITRAIKKVTNKTKTTKKRRK